MLLCPWLPTILDREIIANRSSHNLLNTTELTPVERARDARSQLHEQKLEHAVNVRTHTRSNISYCKYFAALIIQCIKYFIFNFVVLINYKNISTTKISGFTVI